MKGKRSWKSKFLVNLLVVCLLLFVLWFLNGCPIRLLMPAFRMAEKAQMVGPSTVLGVEDVEFLYYNKLVVADNGDSVVLYGFNRDENWHNALICYEKTGSLTVLPGPISIRETIFEESDEFLLPIVLFDKYPEAAHAQISFTLRYLDKSTFCYELEASRTNPGYFLFQLPYNNPERTSDEAIALNNFAEASGPYGMGKLTVPISVRLYSEDGTLLYEEEVLFQSPRVTAHLEQGDPME